MSVNHEFLKAVIKSLNDTGLGEKKIKTVIEIDTAILMKEFMSTMDGILDDDKKADQIPDEIYTYYQNVPLEGDQEIVESEPEPDTATEDGPEVKAEPPDASEEPENIEIPNEDDVGNEPDDVEDVESEEVKPEPEECPGYGKNFDEYAEECLACRDDYPKDYHGCKEICRPLAEPEIEISPWNHSTLTTSGAIDMLLLKGIHYGELVDLIAKHFNKSLGKARSLVNGHHSHLRQAHDLGVEGFDKGIPAKTPVDTFLKLKVEIVD